MSFHHSPKIITNGLVLYLDAANSSSYVDGTLWSDMIGNNHITLSGLTYENNNLGAFVFNGSSDYGLLNDTVVFSNYNTISLWIDISLVDAVSRYFLGGISGYGIRHSGVNGFLVYSGGVRLYNNILVQNRISLFYIYSSR